MSDGFSLIDLSHAITDGMITYPGIPGPRLGSHLTFEESAGHYAPGTEFSIGTIAMAANTGTYLDTPAHRFRGATDLSTMPLARMVNLAAVVLSPLVSRTDELPVDGRPEIGDLGIDGLDLAGKAVLIHTGHARRWGTDDYLTNHPFLNRLAVQQLIAADVALVGIDSLNIDGTHTGERPAHTGLLAAGIPIVEHLTNLDLLPTSGSRFFAPPPKVVGMATFTVRAFAIVGVIVGNGLEGAPE